MGTVMLIFSFLGKKIAGLFAWIIEHPVVLAAIALIVFSLWMGHQWGFTAGAHSQDKQVKALNDAVDDLTKQAKDYQTALAERKQSIEVSSKSVADALADQAAKFKPDMEKAASIGYQRGLAEAKKNGTIKTVTVYVKVPEVKDKTGKVTTAANESSMQIMTENGALVCDKFPTATKNSINGLIQKSNDWYPPVPSKATTQK